MRSHANPNGQGTYCQRITLSVIALLMVVAAIGCGGGHGDNDNGEGPGPATPTPTQAVGRTATASPLSSPTPVVAVAVGALRVATNEEAGVIVRSADGGSTWSVVRTAPGAINAVTFADSTNGWAVGRGDIVNTTNAGASWEVQREEPEDLRDVAFRNATTGVAVGSSPPTPPNVSGPALVLETSTGGQQWSPATLPQSTVLDRATLMAVCITSSGTAVTFGEGTSGAVVLRSSDEGNSWVDVSERLNAEGLKDVECVGTEMWAVGMGPRAFHSADGGNTWEDRSAPLQAIFTGELHAAEFITPSVGYVAGNRLTGSPSTPHPIIVRTTDGGVTWQEQSLPAVAEAATIFGISVSSPNGCAVGESSANGDASGPVGVATRDDGNTWSRGIFPDEVGALADVDVLP